MRGKRGFTLVKLAVILAILAAFTAIAIPTVNGFIVSVQKIVCATNRTTLLHFWTLEVQTNPACTLTDVVSGAYEQSYMDVKNCKCPSGGTYTVKDDKILCNVHGEGTQGRDKKS